MSDGFDTLLLKGFAQDFADNIDFLTWRADGSAYEPAETAVCLIKVPTGPDRVVALTVYSIGDDPSLSNSGYRLQTRSRGARNDTTDAGDIDSALSDFLLGNYPRTLPTGIRITKIRRVSSAPFGIDDNLRTEIGSNYELGAHRPTPYRF